jgi:hypothetical protein
MPNAKRQMPKMSTLVNSSGTVARADPFGIWHSAFGIVTAGFLNQCFNAPDSDRSRTLDAVRPPLVTTEEPTAAILRLKAARLRSMFSIGHFSPLVTALITHR